MQSVQRREFEVFLAAPLLIVLNDLGPAEQMPRDVGQSEAFLVRWSRIMRRLDHQLHVIAAGVELDRDLGLLEIHLVAAAIVAANDDVSHRYISLANQRMRPTM